ncbi:MAG: ATP-binding cassette domain-containing protein, partial [Clostridia bacterium]|nr:ATP-binding cassette domain-containing protein [Clostridia bacterium]
MALIEIKNLSFSYPGCSETIKNINLSVEQGDFVALFGPTGSGKTTLLRLLKPELSPLGETEGSILFGGKEIKELSQAESSAIGFVQQSTEHQTVTDKVWHEIAFGMENLNY